MNQRFEPCLAPPPPRFTPKQGQYLAFIHAYTLVLGRPPAHADPLHHFRVTPFLCRGNSQSVTVR